MYTDNDIRCLALIKIFEAIEFFLAMIGIITLVFLPHILHHLHTCAK